MKLSVTKFSIEHLVHTGCTDLIVEGIKELEAENARLRTNTDKLCKHGDLEIERLKAENDRLRQAGDAMADALSPFRNRPFDTVHLCELQDAWGKAKEFKQP